MHACVSNDQPARPGWVRLTPTATPPPKPTNQHQPRAQCDVWAAGVLAYELLVGRPPFEVADEAETRKKIMFETTVKFPPHGEAVLPAGDARQPQQPLDRAHPPNHTHTPADRARVEHRHPPPTQCPTRPSPSSRRCSPRTRRCGRARPTCCTTPGCGPTSSPWPRACHTWTRPHSGVCACVACQGSGAPRRTVGPPDPPSLHTPHVLIVPLVRD